MCQGKILQMADVAKYVECYCNIRHHSITSLQQIDFSMRNAAGIIVYRICEGIPEVLLLFNGRWSPPKGGREKGESEIENALRETYEETGLTVSDLKIRNDYRYEFEYRKCGKTKRIVIFLARILDPHHIITISHEHSKYKWMVFEEAVISRNHSPSNDQFSEMYKNVFEFIKSLI